MTVGFGRNGGLFLAVWGYDQNHQNPEARRIHPNPFDTPVEGWKVADVLDEQNSGKDDRALMRVIQFSSAFGLGIMGAVLYSVKEVSPGLKYEISFGTAVAFLAAAALSWVFWRLVFGRRNEDDRPATSRRLWFAVLSLLVIVATVVPFVCALKGVTHEKVIEIAQGTAIALGALSVVGFLFWRVTRFLKADSERNETLNGRGRNRTE